MSIPNQEVHLGVKGGPVTNQEMHLGIKGVFSSVDVFIQFSKTYLAQYACHFMIKYIFSEF